jgi:hypothetical protein
LKFSKIRRPKLIGVKVNIGGIGKMGNINHGLHEIS